VDTIAATNCVFEPPKDLQLPRKMKKPHSGGTPMGSSLPGILLYSGKLSREKTFPNWWKVRFLRRKLSQMARFCRTKGCHAPKFCGENFHE